MSTDDGNTWTRLNLVGANLQGYCFAKDKEGYLYAGTDKGGYRTTTSTSVPDGEAQPIPVGYSLLQNYPNPFNPTTTIRFSIPTRNRIVLSVYNTLGQKIDELVNEEMAAGYYERMWTATVSSGIYFYRLEAVPTDQRGPRFVETRKMIILK
jgi:hypothetical protein